MSESILQFGAGRFLRGFIDRFVSDLNQTEHPIGSVVVVQSTPGSRAELINQAKGTYPVIVRGIQAGEQVEHTEIVDSISRAIIASEAWDEVLRVGAAATTEWIVTNATEAGYVLSSCESPLQAAQIVPETLPGKLTAVLWQRYQGDRIPIRVLPCELIASNADKLRDLVASQAQQWGLSAEFTDFVKKECTWLNNLVDCIISDLPENDDRRRENPLAIAAEPYAFLAIQRPSGGDVIWAAHPRVELVDDLEPYYLRKVRVLNGIHTAMVATYYGSHLETVQDVLRDAEGNRWTRDLLYGEILPTLLPRVDHAVAFADDTLDRFANPFMSHKLSDIRLNHEEKVPVRLTPTADDYERIFGMRPPLLQAAIDRQLKP